MRTGWCYNQSMELSLEDGEARGEEEERVGGRGRELPHKSSNTTPLFQPVWRRGRRNEVNNKTWPLTEVSGVSRLGGKG